jgi:hemerythrin-like metal-binding protein
MADWTSQLTLNHEVLDAQHAEIFRCLVALAEALAGPPEEIEVAVAALSDALVTHLATEERIMDEALYPERARHKSAHELFMADFLQLRELLRDEGPTPAVADWVTRRTPEWLRFHISVNDFPLGVYLARRGPQAGAPARDGGRRPS